MVRIAHETQITGAVSEITAQRALMNFGWEVSKPLIPEVYDLLARDPLNGKTYRLQVKTVRVRTDRGGELVVYGKKSNGKPYTTDDCDYMVGVQGDTVYMLECQGFAEYWATEQTAKKRWIELSAKEAV